jgi:predicted nucleotidyltransferase
MFEEMLRALVDRGIRFVVVGGVAATIHGSARYTNDLDICYSPDRENLERLVALLTEWNAYLRGVERGLPFILDVRTFSITPLLTLVTSHGDFDLLDRVPGVGSYDDAVARSEEAQIGTVRFRTISLDALIDAKRAARRKKDIEHLIELEALRELRDTDPSPA